MEENRREHYRIEYPVADRPTVVIAGVRHTILNLSEKGMLVLSNTRCALTVRHRLNVEIVFKSKNKVKVTGIVLRISNKVPYSFIVKFSNAIELALIFKEQRFLINKYKK